MQPEQKDATRSRTSDAINAELANYSEELARKPQVIAANKTDAIYDLEESPVEQLRKEFGPKGIDVFPISAVSGKGVNELLYHVRQMLGRSRRKADCI